MAGTAPIFRVRIDTWTTVVRVGAMLSIGNEADMLSAW
jgi:hypothetical protein